MARFTRGADLSRRSRLAIGLSSAIVTLMCLGLARADEDDEEAIEQPVAVANDSAEEEAAESGVSLPTDRLRERQLDRARRLVADKRWSDAATLLDEILAADRDFFFCPDLQKSTWRSIKSDASRLVGELPPEGREAYGLQFRARAERLLAQAIAHGDADGVIAVARRWPHTPAGQQATVLAALAAIDDNQPLAAIAWLDRLTAASAREFEPTVSLMRAKAWWLAGQRDKALEMLEQARATGAASVRVGGRDVSLSFPPGNNPMARRPSWPRSPATRPWPAMRPRPPGGCTAATRPATRSPPPRGLSSCRDTACRSPATLRSRGCSKTAADSAPTETTPSCPPASRWPWAD